MEQYTLYVRVAFVCFCMREIRRFEQYVSVYTLLTNVRVLSFLWVCFDILLHKWWLNVCVHRFLKKTMHTMFECRSHSRCKTVQIMCAYVSLLSHSCESVILDDCTLIAAIVISSSWISHTCVSTPKASASGVRILRFTCTAKHHAFVPLW